MLLKEVKVWLKALCSAAVGAAVFTGGLLAAFYLISWAFFSSALKDPVYVKSLHDSAGMGVMAGAVVGLGLVLQSARPYARKIAGGLCIWIGSTLSLISPLAIVTLTVRSLTWHPPLKSDPYALASTWSVFLPLWIAGIMPLHLSFKLLSFPSWKRILIVLAEGFKATFLPGCEKQLCVFRIESSLNEAQFFDRLEQLADVARNSRHRYWLSFPLRDSKDVIAMLKGDRLLLMRSNAWYPYELCGKIGEEGGIVFTRLQSELLLAIRCFMAFYYAGLSLVTLFLVITMPTELLRSPKPFETLLIIVPFASIWYFVLSFMRCYRWMGWRQEKYIIDWLYRNFDAKVIESYPAKKRFYFF